MRSFVLCYHKVGPAREESEWLNIEPATLRTQIQFFKRRGADFVLARDLTFGVKIPQVCLTFDDAYVSTLTHGLEVMVSESVRGSIYAVAGKVGQKSDWDGARARPLADLSLLLQAEEQGFEIGNHTFSHRRLPELSLDEQREDIQKAHELFVRQGLAPSTCAYPYGGFNQDTEQVLSSLGYRHGFGLSRRGLRSSDAKFRLPRIVVGYGDQLPQLVYKLWIRPSLPNLKSRPYYIP